MTARYAIGLVTAAGTGACLQVHDMDIVVGLEHPCNSRRRRLHAVAPRPLPPLCQLALDEGCCNPALLNSKKGSSKPFGTLLHDSMPYRVKELYNWELSVVVENLVQALCDVAGIMAVSTARKPSLCP